jgi:hypothetical protein
MREKVLNSAGSSRGRSVARRRQRT